MKKIMKPIIFAFMCLWVLFLPSLAGATLITGSSTGTGGTPISATANITFTTHNFGSGLVNAFQIVLTNTATDPLYTDVRGNLLTGFFWTFDWTVVALDTNATGFDGLAGTVFNETPPGGTISDVDIAPAVAGSGMYQLNNFYLASDTIANDGGDYSAYDYAIGTVGYGLSGFNGNRVDGDDYGIFATSSSLTGGLDAALPLIQNSATFWIRAPSGVTTVPSITNYFFAYGSLPDNTIPPDAAKVPEPLTLILYGFGFAGAGLYRHLRRRPK